MMLTNAHLTIVLASALFVLSTRTAHGLESTSEDVIEASPRQIAMWCTNDPDLEYLHFNANLGITSYKDCEWVGEDPYERCALEATNGELKKPNTPFRRRSRNLSMRESPKIWSRKTLQLSDFCPLSCGLCPTAPLPPEGELSKNDLTKEELEQMDLSPHQLDKFERNRPHPTKDSTKKPKKVKPCNCPGQDHSGGDDVIEEDPILAPTTTTAPTTAPTIQASAAPTVPVTRSPTSIPTANPTISVTTGGTTSSTFSGTATTTFTGTTGYTTSATTSGTTSATTSGTTSATTSGTTSATFSGTVVNAAIDAVIDGQQSSVNNRSRNRKLAIFLSVVPIFILILVWCCLLRRKMRRAKQRKNFAMEETDDSDDERGEYPIHKTKSADSTSSRFMKAFNFFNGRRDDERNDVRRCASSVCVACDDSPRRVLSVDSFEQRDTMPKPNGDRYKMVNEVEC